MARYSTLAWRAFRPATADCRVLGLDPGSQCTGYGVVDCTAAGERHVASGCIRLAAGPFSTRLRAIYEAVAALVADHAPGEIAIERVFVHRNPDSALKLGQARGAALCAATIGGAPVYDYSPRAIKLAVTGYGAAEKSQVARMVTSLLALERSPAADAADALAIALCHAQNRRLGGLRLEDGATDAAAAGARTR